MQLRTRPHPAIPSMRLLLACTLVVSLLAVSAAAASVSPTPAAAWIPVFATVDGAYVEDPHGGMWPADRCNHKMVPISAEMARTLAPEYHGTWREGVDPHYPDWTAGIALLMGGVTWGGVVPLDMWLLQTNTSIWAAHADWHLLNLDQSAGLSYTPPPDVYDRHGYSMQYSRTRNELYIFGGYSDYWVTNLEDVWRFDLSGGGVWTWLANDVDPDLHPSARLSSSTEWVLVPGASADVQKLLLFSGHGKGIGSSVPSPNDLWSYDLSDANTASGVATWSNPEGFACGAAGRAPLCTDSTSFADLFSDLSVPLHSIIDQYHTNAPLVRPEDVADYANALLVLQEQLGQMLNSTKYTNYSATHDLVDKPCTDWCLRRDVTAAGPNRPAAREGHGMSLLEWTDPATGNATMQLVVFGGRLLDCPSVGSDTARGPDCYDPALYFLDLSTWAWTKRDPSPSAFLPGEVEPQDLWPARRAWHSQAIYHPPAASGSAAAAPQLWVFAGHSYDDVGLATFKTDLSVYDFGLQRWFLQLPNPSRGPPLMQRPTPGYIDVQGQYGYGYNTSEQFSKAYDQHKGVMRGASWIAGDAWWVHGGCSTSTPTQELEPINDEHGTLWALKLGSSVQPADLRVANDATKWLFGQGVTHAQPGPLTLPNGDPYRYNYFYMEVSTNLGTNLTSLGGIDRDANQTNALLLRNARLVGTPNTNSTVLPYWGPLKHWGTGMLNRLQVQLISNFVPASARAEGAVAGSSSGGIISSFGNPGVAPYETAEFDAIYGARYSVTEGSQYEIYISWDGVDVPGSPFLLSLETGVASGADTVPADLSRPIPPIKFNATSGKILTQNYGNLGIPRPLAGNGLGLIKGLRGGTASFLLQIVDIYQNNWIDDSNTVRYLTNDVSSAVPFHAIHLNLHLIDPVSGQLLRNMSLFEYNYINNAEGTFTVTYLCPDMPSWGLAVEINGEIIAHGKTYIVQGVEPLALDSVQTAGMLGVSATVSGVILLCFIVFVAMRSHPIQQSRSLLFDGLFTLGACVGTLAVLETTEYSRGTRVGEDLTLHADTHNACQLYNVLLSLAMLLCYGSLYGMVVRAHLIMESIKKSATAREEKKKSSIIHLTSELDSAAPPNAPLPLIPGMPTDVEIFAPVLLMIVIELIFQTIWIGVAPLRPTATTAADNFRTYQICDGDSKRVWVYVDIGILGVMCCYLVMKTSAGRVVVDPLGEPRMTTWASYNMAFTTIVCTLLTFLLDANDSIKTSFIVGAFAIAWSCLLFCCLVFLPRVRNLLTIEPEAVWYDAFIQAVQEETIAAKQRQEKEDREGNKSQMGTSNLNLNASSMGNSSSSGGGANISSAGNNSVVGVGAGVGVGVSASASAAAGATSSSSSTAGGASNSNKILKSPDRPSSAASPKAADPKKVDKNAPKTPRPMPKTAVPMPKTANPAAKKSNAPAVGSSSVVPRSPLLVGSASAMMTPSARGSPLTGTPASAMMSSPLSPSHAADTDDGRWRAGSSIALAPFGGGDQSAPPGTVQADQIILAEDD